MPSRRKRMSKPPINGPCDGAYQQGIEDTADKVLGLIHSTNEEITVREIREFLEAERDMVGRDEVYA